ncbi:MAG: glycosyltransferase family 4 protein [Deltaproteobacteria bacterium]|nr:glycosyltransferase family 4 protein [Deltaproteobacteria bacterium]
MRLCIAGTMLGRHRGLAPGQGEQVAALLEQHGHHARTVSAAKRSVQRLAEITTSILTARPAFDAVAIDTYSGRAFVIADAASRAALARGTAVVFSLHGGALPEMMADSPEWVRSVLSRADAIVCQTPYLGRAMTRAGMSVELVPNLVRTERYPFLTRGPARPRVLWMRTFHEIYGPAVALEAFRILKRAYPEATLEMAGADKGLLEETRRRALELGLEGSITFPGFLDFPSKLRATADADLFLNTSRVDNTPVAMIEACATGMLVVSTRAGGIPDLVAHEETALLVPIDDAPALGAAMIRAVREPALARRLSTNGRELAERSSPSAVLARWEEVFASAIERRRSRS